MIDCLPPGAPASAMMRALYCLRRGGRAVNVGAVMETLPINAFWLMTNRIGLQGSVWFTTGEGEEMAAMAGAGTLDLVGARTPRVAAVQSQRGARRHGRSRWRLHQFRHRPDARRVTHGASRALAARDCDREGTSLPTLRSACETC